MTRKKRSLSEDEHTLWTVVTRSIKPLRRRKAVTAPQEEIAPPAMPPRKLAKIAMVVPPPAPPASRMEPPPLAPLGRRLKQKIGRGSEPIDARIDLHGMTQASAHSALAHFLRRAQHDGARVVLVITGKGKAGTDPHAERGVLKRQVPMWLESPELRPLIVGLEAANIGHGGAGALYVRLRKAASTV
jgi:DNA-nicking Smr family endonuclease